MKKQFLFIFLGLLMSGYTFAQGEKTVALELLVDYDTVGLNEQFNITYKISNATILGQFELPALEGFELIAGPMVSHNVSYINGDKTEFKSYSYTLRPTELGTYYIAGGLVETAEGTLLSDDKTLVVVEQVDRPALSNSFFENGFQNDVFGQQRGLRSMEDMQKQMDKMWEKFEDNFNRMEEDIFVPRPPKPSDSEKKEKKYKGKVYKI